MSVSLWVWEFPRMRGSGQLQPLPSLTAPFSINTLVFTFPSAHAMESFNPSLSTTGLYDPQDLVFSSSDRIEVEE